MSTIKPLPSTKSLACSLQYFSFSFSISRSISQPSHGMRAIVSHHLPLLQLSITYWEQINSSVRLSIIGSFVNKLFGHCKLELNKPASQSRKLPMPPPPFAIASPNH